MTQQELQKLLQQERLIHTDPTLMMIHPDFLANPSGGIYYGTGLCTPKAPSVGLPFDVLVLVLTAEFFRRSLGLDAIHHHIADTHALSNDFCTPEGVAEIAAEYRDVLMRIARVTGVELNVHLSSEFDTTDTYKALLSEIHTGKGEYVDRELTDMLWYRRQHGVSLKLGWLIQAIKSEQGFDERLYDEAFREHCDGGMSFAYVQPGRTFDQRRMKASPYIAIPGERRIVFKPDTNARAVYEEAVEVWGDKKLGGAVNHLNAVLRLWDKISKTPAPRTGDVIDRVQAIIDLVFEN